MLLQGKTLNHNVTQGIIISNRSLVLQKVDRRSAGNYTCVGYNTEGDGESTPFYLRVMCEYCFPAALYFIPLFIIFYILISSFARLYFSRATFVSLRLDFSLDRNQKTNMTSGTFLRLGASEALQSRKTTRMREKIATPSLLHSKVVILIKRATKIKDFLVSGYTLRWTSPICTKCPRRIIIYTWKIWKCFELPGISLFYVNKEEH